MRARALALAVGLAVACAARGAEAQAPDPAGATAASAAEVEPIDEETRAAERQAGFLGLSGWTVLGVAGGLWLALRWRRTRRS